jgi:uncharacterized membrane protein
MNYKSLSLAIASTLALTVLTASAEDQKLDASKLPPASDKSGVTYESDIKAIFEKSCVKCHSGEKAKSKLHLDSLAGAVKGGKQEDGPDIVPGDSAKSHLVYNVAHVGDEDDFMPPPKNKANIQPLTKEQVGLIRAWIDQGAK